MQGIYNQLKANSDWIDKHFAEADSGIELWAKMGARSALDHYRLGNLDASINALAVCVAQLCHLLDWKTERDHLLDLLNKAAYYVDSMTRQRFKCCGSASKCWVRCVSQNFSD